MARITVLLADDSLIVRAGMRALLSIAGDLEVVGEAGDLGSLVAGAEALAPQVIVSDIRMPPTFQLEGIEAAHTIRKRHPGMGIVILSQFDEPEYALSLLGNGAAGCAYLLKNRVAESDQLVRAIRTVSAGGTLLDPRVVDALARPKGASDLSPSEQELLRMVADGRSIKQIALVQRTTQAAAAESVERVFVRLSRHAIAGEDGALRQLRMLHQAIVDRAEQGERLSRMLPGGVAERVRGGGRAMRETERLVVTVMMSDIRGYSTIAEASDPSCLAGQLSEYRAAASRAVLAARGTVMQFVGDAVMAVFGAPDSLEDHADRALEAALEMQRVQAHLNGRWEARGLPPLPIGIGLSSGPVVAAFIGGEERLEYSLVGDVVNLAQRLQELAGGGEVVLSEATYSTLTCLPDAIPLGPTFMKGRQRPVSAFRVLAGPNRVPRLSY